MWNYANLSVQCDEVCRYYIVKKKNFGGKKLWRIWQMAFNLSNEALNRPLRTDNVKVLSHYVTYENKVFNCNLWVRYEASKLDSFIIQSLFNLLTFKTFGALSQPLLWDVVTALIKIHYKVMKLHSVVLSLLQPWTINFWATPILLI